MAGLIITFASAIPVQADEPTSEKGVLLLVPLGIEPTEEQMAESTAEVAGSHSLDSSAWSSGANQAAADEPSRQSSEQAAWEQIKVGIEGEFATSAPTSIQVPVENSCERDGIRGQ